jgi:NAD(P)-dependent dehydrogenase (short-subunit alcohol dehydrogenase family)
MAVTGMELEGRVAVVLGGTTGIGRAIALGLARAGADVVASGRRLEQVDATATEIARLGRRSLRLASDVTQRASLETMLGATVEAFGRVDVLVNSAGKIRRRPTLDVAESEWNDILETNHTGTLRACGRIINIASLTSFVALYEVAAYGASKAALVALTQSLAIEWGSRGVCVNAIAPGIFRTHLNEQLLDGTPRGRELLERTPMKRFGRVEETAGAAVFLASDAASFINGHVLVVDGGFLASGVNQ